MGVLARALADPRRPHRYRRGRRMSRARPERLGDLLRGYLSESGLEERLAEAEAVPDWESRVGEAIAAVTTPLRVSRGTLVVAVRSSVWLMELQMMERQIRTALNEG